MVSFDFSVWRRICETQNTESNVEDWIMQSPVDINASVAWNQPNKHTASYAFANFGKLREKKTETKRNEGKRNQLRSTLSRSIFTNEFLCFMLWMHKYYWIKKLKRINYPLPLLTAFYDPFHFYYELLKNQALGLNESHFELLLFLWFSSMLLLALCMLVVIFLGERARGWRSYFVSGSIVNVVFSGRFICATIDSTLFLNYLN